MKKKLAITAVALVLVLVAVGGSLLGGQAAVTLGTGVLITTSAAETETAAAQSTSATDAAASAASLSTTGGSALDVSGLFTERDLQQTADLENATAVTLTSGEDVTIDKEGVYLLSGDVTEVTVTVDAGDDAKVQLVLDGLQVTNAHKPAIEILTADKVFITLADNPSHLEVTGAYETASMDAVIVSKSDLTLNGSGALELVSAQGDGITSKDDLKITGGTYTITAVSGLKANDSIRICGGTFTITAGSDALHSENKEDNTLGYIYLSNATLDITAQDDAIQGNAIVQIDSGTIRIHTSSEGIEATHVQINGGEITIYATDDGINAAQKSAYDVLIEINGGVISVEVGSGDTDALDSNGDLYINGGTLSVTANSAFDYDNTGVLNGGTVTVNGEAVTVLTPSQMGGGPMGGGMMGGHGGKPGR